MADTNTITRRAALTGATAAAIAPLATTPALATADPALTAHAAWKEAENRFLAAWNRADMAGGQPCVMIPSLRGKPQRIGTDAGIDHHVKQETLNKECDGANWVTDPGNADRIARIRAKQETARRFVVPDADALKAELHENKARYAAAFAERNVEALEAEADRLREALIETPATTFAGIALKLRLNGETAEDFYVEVVLRDLDRMAVA